MPTDINNLLKYRDPVELIPLEELFTADEAIRSRKQIEIIPREQSSVGFDDTDVLGDGPLSKRLRFYVNDSTHYLDMKNSYMTCEFTAQVKTDGNAVIPDRFLDEGGIHSCIRTVTVSIGGTVLERIDDYSKWYNACKNFPMHSSEYRNRVLAAAGDSTASQTVSDYDRVPITADVATATYTVGGTVLDLPLGNAEEELVVGDVIQVIGADGKQYEGEVTAITSSTDVVVNLFATADILSGDIKGIYKISDVATRKLVANGSTHRLTFALPLGSLSLEEYFPLPLIEGYGPLEIDIEFNEAQLALVLGSTATPASGNRFGYSLKRPRFIASMVRPGKMADGHKALWSSQGMLFPFTAWRHYENTIQSNSQDVVLNVQSNLNSVRGVVSVQTDQVRANSSQDVTSQNYKSQSTFLRENLIRYRYQNGSERYPEYSEVRMDDDVFGAQAWEQLSLTFDNKVSMYDNTSIKPSEWRGLNSSKFIISAPMKKHASLYSGADLSLQYLEIDLQKSAASEKALAVHTWLAHDSVLMLSKKEGVRIFK